MGEVVNFGVYTRGNTPQRTGDAGKIVGEKVQETLSDNSEGLIVEAKEAAKLFEEVKELYKKLKQVRNKIGGELNLFGVKQDISLLEWLNQVDRLRQENLVPIALGSLHENMEDISKFRKGVKILESRFLEIISKIEAEINALTDNHKRFGNEASGKLSHALNDLKYDYSYFKNYVLI